MRKRRVVRSGAVGTPPGTGSIGIGWPCGSKPVWTMPLAEARASRVGVAVGVGVAVSVGAAVVVATAVGSGVAVPVAVGIGVAVPVEVGIGVAVGVDEALAVGPEAVTVSASGSAAPPTKLA